MDVEQQQVAVQAENNAGTKPVVPYDQKNSLVRHAAWDRSGATTTSVKRAASALMASGAVSTPGAPKPNKMPRVGDMAAAQRAAREAAKNNKSISSSTITSTASQPDSLTEKGALAFSTTSCKRLDFFFSGTVRKTDKSEVVEKLAESWAEHAEETLEIVANTRDCRNGKGERAVVQHALLWLRKNKPKTYLLNLLRFLSLGYFKDLLHMCVRVCEDSLPKLGEHDLIELEVFADFLRDDDRVAQQIAALGPEATEEEEGKKQTAANVADAANASAGASSESAAANVDAAITQFQRSTLEHRSTFDEPMSSASSSSSSSSTSTKTKTPSTRRALLAQLSLAGKWCPTEDSHFDKKHKLAKRLAVLLFPVSSSAKDVKRAEQYSLMQYRRMCSRLRDQLRVVERLISSDRWSAVAFNEVPSKAHLRLRKAFREHQAERYEAYLESVKKGETAIKSQGLQPHELVIKYMQGGDSASAADDTIELQWQDLLSKLRAKGALQSVVAVCDVSGSMTNGSQGGPRPLDVCIALGLLIAEVAPEPWRKRVLTFDSNPQWVTLPEGSLYTNVQALAAAPWGGSTNLQATFDLILAQAHEYNVAPADMPRMLIIFSDMQFDAADSSFHNANGPQARTNYQAICDKYATAGYPVPQLIFWNLAAAAGTSAPVQSNALGVGLLSGYSSELLAALFDDFKDLSPLALLAKVLAPYKGKFVVEESER